MDKLERRFGRFSIINLTIYIIIGKIFGFFLMFFNLNNIYDLLTLNIDKVMSGQVWRLITFMFIPENDNIFFFIFEILFLYWIGTGLEAEWGSFKYTVYIGGCILGVTVASVIAYFLGFTGILYVASSMFVYTMFLPFAWYYGDEELRIMFLFPIKVKYLAIIDVLLIIRIFVFTQPVEWIILILSMINMIVFFAVVLTRRAKHKSRYIGFKTKVNKAERDAKKKTLHRCAVCGITEKDDPGMSFRYCSKCEGDYEFCEKHLKEHEHYKKVIDVDFRKDQ